MKKEESNSKVQNSNRIANGVENRIKEQQNQALREGSVYDFTPYSSPRHEDMQGLSAFESFIFDILEGALSRSIVSSPLLRLQMMQQTESELYRIGCITSPYATMPVLDRWNITPYKALVDLPPHKNYIAKLLRTWSQTESIRRQYEENSRNHSANSAYWATSWRNEHGDHYPGYRSPLVTSPDLDSLGLRPRLPTVKDRHRFQRSSLASTAAFRMDQYATESHQSLIGSLTRGLALNYSWTFVLSWFINAISANVCRIAFDQDAQKVATSPPPLPDSPLSLGLKNPIASKSNTLADTTEAELGTKSLPTDVIPTDSSSFFRRWILQTLQRWKRQLPVVMLSTAIFIPIRAAVVFVNSVPHSTIKDWWKTVWKDKYGLLGLYNSFPLALAEWLISDAAFHGIATCLFRYLSSRERPVSAESQDSPSHSTTTSLGHEQGTMRPNPSLSIRTLDNVSSPMKKQFEKTSFQAIPEGEVSAPASASASAPTITGTAMDNDIGIHTPASTSTNQGLTSLSLEKPGKTSPSPSSTITSAPFTFENHRERQGLDETEAEYFTPRKSRMMSQTPRTPRTPQTPRTPMAPYPLFTPRERLSRLSMRNEQDLVGGNGDESYGRTTPLPRSGSGSGSGSGSVSGRTSQRRAFWKGDEPLQGENVLSQGSAPSSPSSPSSLSLTPTQDLPMYDKRAQKPGFFSSLTFVGLVSSILATASIYPLQTLRTRLNLGIGLPSYISQPSALEYFSRIVKVEGFKALWAGFPAAILVLIVDEICKFGMQRLREWYIDHRHTIQGILRETSGSGELK